MLKQKSEPQTSLLQRVEDLVTLLHNSSIDELELTERGTEIIIRRQTYNQNFASLSQPQTPQAQKVLTVPASQAKKEDQSLAITAPFTGVFYHSPSPDLPPFVKVGDRIQPEQVVALIETMKVFNEVSANVSGLLSQICVEKGAIVRKGDVLFRVEPL